MILKSSLKSAVFELYEKPTQVRYPDLNSDNSTSPNNELEVRHSVKNFE